MLPFNSRSMLLWVLTTKPFFGLEIHERLHSMGLKINTASIYLGLRALHKEGLVQMWTELQPDPRGANRIFYKLTASGRQESKRLKKLAQIALTTCEAA